jgi:hypothetical protein
MLLLIMEFLISLIIITGAALTLGAGKVLIFFIFNGFDPIKNEFLELGAKWSLLKISEFPEAIITVF